MKGTEKEAADKIQKEFDRHQPQMQLISPMGGVLIKMMDRALSTFIDEDNPKLENTSGIIN